MSDLKAALSTTDGLTLVVVSAFNYMSRAPVLTNETYLMIVSALVFILAVHTHMTGGPQVFHVYATYMSLTHRT